MAAAQSQIDQITASVPFNPARNQTPACLALDATREGAPLVQDNVPIYADSASHTASQTASHIALVTGTMTTHVVDTQSAVALDSSSNAALTIYRATVTVSYRFRDHRYDVRMSTLRASDS
jgi:hypothetical protein